MHKDTLRAELACPCDRWHDWGMQFWEFVGTYWWLAFPLAGIVGGWGRAVSKNNERRHQRKIEMYKLQHPDVAGLGMSTPVSSTDSAGHLNLAKDPQEFTTSDVDKATDAHDAVNRRWLDYELDVGKLIDFPMMTDVREPLTVAFLRAKRDADALRPVTAQEITSKIRWDDYRNAVNAYAVAFDIAEKEAKRIKDTAFSEPQRQRLNTARKLVNIAENEAASPAERQTAYKRARHELEGLIVLPDITTAALEQRIATMIERGK